MPAKFGAGTGLNQVVQHKTSINNNSKKKKASSFVLETTDATETKYNIK